MVAQSPVCLLSETGKNFGLIILFITTAILCQAETVNIRPGNDIPTIVAAAPAGTTFLIYPGTYRLQAHIVPKSGDSFIGQTSCAPPTTRCTAVITGSTVIGTLATFNGTNWQVTGQTQQGVVTDPNTVCQPGYLACNLPEDLFFDGQPYQHLDATSLPTIGPGQWWFDYTNHIIYFSDNPTGHTVETSVLDTAFDSAANNVTIQYLTFEGFAAPLERGAVEPTVGNAAPSSSANWIVSYCEFYNNHGDGVRVAYGINILNNFIHNNGTIGIGGSTNSASDSGIVIQGNLITHNNYAHVLGGHGAGGVKMGYTTGATIRGNTIRYNDGAGIHFDASSANPLIDGNLVAYNTGGGGVEYEISVDAAVLRNNILLSNALQDLVPASLSSIGSYASVGVDAYCNVIQVPYNPTGGPGVATNAMTIVASDRGDNQFPPYEYLVSTGNSLHHNTVIWKPNATGVVGYIQADAANQPNFFADNSPPDYNTYHLPSLSDTNFVYDNDNSQKNTHKTFADYQAAGADIHGSADTNTLSGYPTVAITSPPDQSVVSGTVTLESTASDNSGISKVEFYVDWSLQATLTTPPYNFTWSNGTTGWHILSAMAYSNTGISNCNAVSLDME
jgi:parallel beta-helix repeat protein